MGSLISLGVGEMEIDWGKNNIFRNHSALFKIEDVTKIPYYYVNDSGKIVMELKDGYSRKLSSVKQRLNLLGYTLKKARKMYEQALSECYDFNLRPNLSFDNFSRLLKEIDINQICTPGFAAEFGPNGYDFGEFARRCIFPEKEFYFRILALADGDEEQAFGDLETFFENIDPYIVLRLLAENPTCANLNVYWSFNDIVEDGWVKREDIIKPLANSEKILIVTEGSSDAYIIKKTLDSLYPDISDFFKFIDMERNYPFTGVGNLYNFCCGLMKIGVLNNIIVIFDNDVAGNEKYKKLMEMPQMENLLITKLPQSSLFDSMKAIGPQGTSIHNINGVAVSIECFLDFASYGKPPIIRWISYNEKTQQYQGALQNKDQYVRAFKTANLLSGTYNTEKLKILIDYLLDQWNEHGVS